MSATPFHIQQTFPSKETSLPLRGIPPSCPVYKGILLLQILNSLIGPFPNRIQQRRLPKQLVQQRLNKNCISTSSGSGPWLLMLFSINPKWWPQTPIIRATQRNTTPPTISRAPPSEPPVPLVHPSTTTLPKVIVMIMIKWSYGDHYFIIIQAAIYHNPMMIMIIML